MKTLTMDAGNEVFCINDQTELIRISKHGIWVNPDVPVDEAAQKVLAALDENIKHIVDRAVKDSKRDWIGLTDDEVEEAFSFPFHYRSFYKAVEAKLKEKNGC